MAKMKIKERLTAKIDLKDAIFGGTAIYISTLLVTYLLIFGTDVLLRFFNVINENGEFITQTGLFSENLYGLFVAVLLGVFLIIFFLVVLFEESLFSKHEKGVIDLLGLGIVWGMAFVTIDTMIESLVLYLSMFLSWQNYYMLSIRSSLVGIFYWFAVLYIVFLPIAVYYLRKSHREHYKLTDKK